MSEDFRHFDYNNGFHEHGDDYKKTAMTVSADNPPRPHHQMLEYPSYSHISSNFDEIFLQNQQDSFCFNGLLTMPSSAEVVIRGSNDQVPPATPNSSISSDSTEAAKDGGAHEDHFVMKKTTLIEDEEEGPLKKEGKGKKKAEKKQQSAPRFSFMTESEVDHLEDGYRWRKYGQKPVKNSRYPRSYYRCTTQKCPVKKRIERSFENPSIVITTYEGQHNHHLPASLHGPVEVAGIFSPPVLSHHHHQLPLISLYQELISSQMPQYFDGNNNYGGVGASNIIPPYNSPHHQEQEHRNLNVDPQQEQQQLFEQFSDYELLQDVMNNPTFPKQMQP